jgi:hypothetical protein
LRKRFLDCAIDFTYGIGFDAYPLINNDSVTVDDIGAGDSGCSEERVCAPLGIPCEREGEVRMSLLKPEDSVLILLAGDGNESEVWRGFVFLPDLPFSAAREKVPEVPSTERPGILSPTLVRAAYSSVPVWHQVGKAKNSRAK